MADVVAERKRVRESLEQHMYAKLYAQVVASSLTQNEPIDVRGVFFMLLAMADRWGNVAGVDGALARIINVPLETFVNAVERLMQPDPASQSPEHEGRRLIRLEGSPGYFIVNYAKYAGIVSESQRREYFRVKKAESRARIAAQEAPEGGREGQSATPAIKIAPEANGEAPGAIPGAGLHPGSSRNHPRNVQEVLVALEMDGGPADEGMAKAFFDHYEARATLDHNGQHVWKAGESVVGNWRSLLSSWKNREVSRQQQGLPAGGSAFTRTRRQTEKDRETAGTEPKTP